MESISTKFKHWGLTVLIVTIVSTSVSAQKSVYDVVPGSGPKKKKESTSVIDVTKNKPYDKNNKVYYPAKKRKHLPPGQAKKIYGGSAKDYAPGQVKKRKGWYWSKKHNKWYKKHSKHHKHKD